MDRERFDALARLLATKGSRRGALGAILGVAFLGQDPEEGLAKPGKGKGKRKGHDQGQRKGHDKGKGKGHDKGKGRGHTEKDEPEKLANQEAAAAAATDDDAADVQGESQGGRGKSQGKRRGNGKGQGKGKGRGKDKNKGRDEKSGSQRVQAQATNCCGTKSCAKPAKGTNRQLCNYAGQDLSGLNAAGAGMAQVDGRKTTFSTAAKPSNWTGVNFYRACLQESTWFRADLTGANFDQACLFDADLTGAKVNNTTNTHTAKFCRTTLWDGTVSNRDCNKGTACCAACDGQHPCGAGQICCNGRCRNGDCCDDGDCPANEPICTNFNCGPCTDDSQCGDNRVCCDGVCCAPGLLCIRGICQGGCNGNGDCDQGQVCCDQQCVTGDCCDSEDCENPDPICIENTCNSCTSNGQCGAGEVCCDGSCFAGDCCVNGDCPANEPICIDHNCSICTNDNQCGQGQICCDGTCQLGNCCPDSGTAVTCNANQTCCPAGCRNLNNNPNNCGACGNVCLPATPNCCSGKCQECCVNADCPQGEECVEGTCVPTTCNGECLKDGDCPDLADCICCSNTCVTGECCSDLDCENPTPVCNGNNACVACDANNPCNDGEVCCDGSCFAGICCVAADCPDEICQNKRCTNAHTCNYIDSANGLPGPLCLDSICCSGECCIGDGAVCDASNECCIPDTFNETCGVGTAAPKCGDVTNNCGQTIDCGACAPVLCQDGTCSGPDDTCEYTLVGNNLPGPLCGSPSFCCGGDECCTSAQVCFNNDCCTPNSDTVTCQGRCGTVTNNCGQSVQCPACPVLTCQTNTCSPTTQTCVAADQPDGQPGNNCPAPRQCCDGICCLAGQTCVSGVCQGNCGNNPPCGAGFTCCGGTCETGICCELNEGCNPGTCCNGLDCIDPSDPNSPTTCQRCCEIAKDCRDFFGDPDWVCVGDPKVCDVTGCEKCCRPKQTCSASSDCGSSEICCGETCVETGGPNATCDDSDPNTFVFCKRNPLNPPGNVVGQNECIKVSDVCAIQNDPSKTDEDYCVCGDDPTDTGTGGTTVACTGSGQTVNIPPCKSCNLFPGNNDRCEFCATVQALITTADTRRPRRQRKTRRNKNR